MTGIASTGCSSDARQVPGAVKRRFTLCALAALLSGCASLGEYFSDAGAPPPPVERRLADWPYRQYWTGVVFNGRKIGFTRLALRRAADANDRFEIESEALRLRFLGIDKKVNLRSLDRVHEDLSLERFRYEYELDGSPLRVAGSSDGRTVAMKIETSGGTREKSLRAGEPVHPASALALLPVMRGLAVGRSHRFTVLHGETQDLAEVEQSVLAYERSALFQGPAFKVATRMLGLETTTWIGADGRPLFELALHGVLIQALEEEEEARRSLVAASLNRDEALVEFSLLRAPPIAAPRRVSRLEIALEGVPAAIPAPSEGGQACTREGERLLCRVDRGAPLAGSDPARLAGYLRPTLAVSSSDAEIVRLARELSADAADAETRTARMLGWIEANIAREAVDAFTALDVLRERRAECQGHAFLFAALARAMGLPARVVNGLVYSEDYGGFLYHTWNEVHVAGAGWRPVDATLAQPHADATHLKLIEGETVGELAPLVGMIGRARIAAVRALAHW